MKKITLLMNDYDIGKRLKSWETFCFALFFLTNVQYLKAQTASTYAFTQSTGTYTEISGGNVIGDEENDDEVFNNSTTANSDGTGFPIGFDFVFNGTTYSNFAINTNGWIKLGTGSFTIGSTSSALSSSTASGSVIAGFAMDLAAKTGAVLSYSTTGTAPNRKLVVQWKGYSKYSFGGNASDINFQIVLNETTNVVNVIYGAVSTPSGITGTAQVGIKSGNSLAEINNRTSTTDWSATTAGTATGSSITFNPTIVPPSGLTFIWTAISCSGTPVAGTVGGNLNRLVCPGSLPGSISVTGASAFFAGISYQWEESTDNGTSWSNVTGGSGANTASYTPPSFTGTAIQYRLKVTCANGGTSVTSDITTINPQAAPTTQASALTLGNAGATAFTVSWTNGNGGRRYVLASTSPIVDPVSGSGIPAYTAAAAFAGTGEQLVYEGTGTSVTITGITCGTTYYVKVFEYSRCGSGPYDVYFNTTTDTNALTVNSPVTATLPVLNAFTGFTGANLGVAVPGWYEAAIATTAGDIPTANNTVGITSNWVSSTNLTGTTAKVNLFSNTKNEWIISPKILLSADSRIKFKAAITNYNNGNVDPERMQGTDDAVNVMISSDCGATWTSLYTFNAANTTTLTNVLENFTVLIPSTYNGQTVQIGFQATDGPLDDAPDYDFHIGNVLIEQIPDCDKPILAATTNITKNSATINWDVPISGTPSGYQYVVSESNAIPVAAGTDVTATTANVSPLMPSTDYYVFVRSVCGDDFSEWTAAGTFTTLCNYNDITAITPGEHCGAGTATLGATASGGTIRWYATETGGAPIGNGSTFVTPNLTETRSFYAAAEFASAGSAIVGTATTLTGATEQPTAFCNRWSGYKMQILYTVDDLMEFGLRAGDITSLAFNITTLGDGATNDNFTVKIAPSTESSISSSTFATTGFTTVYGPQTYTHTAEGWQTINFASPYTWDGISGILIEVSHDGANLTNNARTYYTATTNNTVLYDTSVSSDSGNLGTKRLNIMLNGQVACSSIRVPAVATITAPPAFTLSADPASICAGETTAGVTIESGSGDYDTYVWTPSTGVSGDAATGWTFNPSVSTTYSLQASQSSGTLCNAEPVTVEITVGQYPSAATVSPSPIAVCEGQSQLLSLTGGTSPGTVVLGDGTTAPSTTSYPNPFSAYYGGTKTQMLFKASELEAQGLVSGGVINSLSFDFFASVDNELSGMEIRIGATTNETTTDGIVPSAGLTTVYSASYTPTEGATGLVGFNLSTPYTYTGGNIIVEIVHNASNSGNGSGTRTKTTTTSFDSVYTLTKDNVQGGVPGFDAETSFSISSASTSRPNIVFNYNIPNTVVWSPVTELYTDAAATVPYTGQNTSTVYVKPTTATTYTVTSTSALGCSVSATVDVSVNVIEAPTVAAPTQEICNAGTVADLMATGTGIKWYAAATGGNALASTTALVDDTPYYASQTVNGCESVLRTMLTPNITIVAAPAIENAEQTFCNLGTVADLMPNDENINWYNVETGGTALDPAATLATGSYYASQTVDGCESAARSMVAVTVNVTAAPTIDNAEQTFCNSGTVADLMPNGTGITWYDVETGGNALDASTVLVDGMSYYASQTINGCEGVLRGMVTANINVVAAPAIDNAEQTFCNSATVADLMPNGAEIMWYDAETGGNALDATTALVDGMSYYASQMVDGCEGLVRGMVTATINVTAAPTGDDEQEFCNSATIADLMVTGDNIIWYDSETDGNMLTAETTLVDGTMYYASQTINNCEGITRLGVTAVVYNVVADAPENVNECSEYTLPELVSGAYFTESNGQGTEIAAGTVITEDTTLYVYAEEGVNVVCSDENMFTITIANVPAPTGEATQTINGDVASDVTVEDLMAGLVEGGTVTWYASEEDAIAGTNPLSSDTQLTQGATYYATQTLDGCTSTGIYTVMVDIVLGREGFDIKAFTFYPNPVKDVLNLSYSTEITSVTVFDLLGQLVINQNPNAAEVKLDMSSLADGAYVVNVTAGNTVKTIKVIKKQ